MAVKNYLGRVMLSGDIIGKRFGSGERGRNPVILSEAKDLRTEHKPSAPLLTIDRTCMRRAQHDTPEIVLCGMT